MMEYKKLTSSHYPKVTLKLVPGHFVTPNSHINYYFDLSTMKTRQNEARAAAEALGEAYYATTVVDTIVCIEGTEVIGAYLAEVLTHIGVMSINQHKTLYIITPEYDSSGQIIFRDNQQIMLRNKHVLLLMPSITTGRTLARAVESILYYDGIITGVSAIFSAVSVVRNIHINALFTKQDIPDYAAYDHEHCLMCKRNEPVTAICNGFGIAPL